MAGFSSEEIASIAHEATRGLQRVLGEQVSFPWEQLGPDLRSSVIDGVEKILIGEITAPADSHANWLTFKADQGWTYGPVKDFAKKEHPDMVPFEELPREQQVKDEIFFALVKILGA